MEIIIFKTDNGIAIVSPNTMTITRLMALLIQQNPKMVKEDALEIAMKTIAEKDVPRILPADKQELRGKGRMPLKEYLTFPIREYKVIDDAEFAPDFQNFKGARKFDLTLDISKAREIQKDRLRIERAPLMAGLDVEYTRAQEIGADMTDIVARKQKLRDVTNLCDSAKTIDELKKIACPV